MSNHAFSGKKSMCLWDGNRRPEPKLLYQDAFAFNRAKTLDSGAVKICYGACNYRKARQSSTFFVLFWVMVFLWRSSFKEQNPFCHAGVSDSTVMSQHHFGILISFVCVQSKELFWIQRPPVDWLLVPGCHSVGQCLWFHQVLHVYRVKNVLGTENRSGLAPCPQMPHSGPMSLTPPGTVLYTDRN